MSSLLPFKISLPVSQNARAYAQEQLDLANFRDNGALCKTAYRQQEELGHRYITPHVVRATIQRYSNRRSPERVAQELKTEYIPITGEDILIMFRNIPMERLYDRQNDIIIPYADIPPRMRPIPRGWRVRDEYTVNALVSSMEDSITLPTQERYMIQGFLYGWNLNAGIFLAGFETPSQYGEYCMRALVPFTLPPSMSIVASDSEAKNANEEDVEGAKMIHDFLTHIGKKRREDDEDEEEDNGGGKERKIHI